ncbi:hypothetical protein NLD30_02470 [SCandidatus Aminicenantes bacterium Aminicenantia_JdfR_composite]|jgi:hypothetical protein|nr:hypothetical protein [SCandidatus Aminicenantes bacterium Aminicenantia_JdfR_composite]MCP2597730.1 hypothetical protein [Candidatus Aminicenantes bacterium AC-335-L06]MCP2620897.1 hypothetical protein [Candidatus Aminicenantes bacterium AC-334-E05]
MIKRLVYFLFLVSLIIFLVDCAGKPEENLLKRYFHAVRLNDTDTMGSMALEPISPEFKSWKIISISEEIVEPVILPDLDKKEKEAKSKLNEHTGIVLDLKNELDEAKMELEFARTARARRAARRKVAEKQAAYDKEYEIHKQLLKEYNKAKEAAEREEKIANFSVLGEFPNIREMTGEIHKKEVIIELNTPEGVKRYKANFRRYILKDPVTNATHRGRWIILNFEPIE